MAHLASDKAGLVARVRRIVGQLTAVERAIEDEADCATLLHQVAGARGAIAGLIDELIEAHLREHVAHPDLDPSARACGADELIKAIRRYAK